MTGLPLFKMIGWSGLLDIAFMAALIYLILAWFKKTRAGFVLTGILIVAAVYMLTRQFNLAMTAAVFEKFFAVILIALVVIFQEELRQFFENIAVWSLKRQVSSRKTATLLRRAEVETLVRSLNDFARERVGAIVVLRAKDILLRHLTGGVDLHGKLSEPLLKSLFDPHSMGHDGAVILEGNEITQFGCHLPLSKDLKKVGRGGTRHAAALGLSERTDALCLAVSEERGTISAARYGEIETVDDPERLLVMLERFYQEINPLPGRSWFTGVKENWKEILWSVTLAVGLWFVLIYASEISYKTFTVPVSYSELPPEIRVESVTPEEVHVTFRAAQRDFYILRKEEIRAIVKLEPKPGAQRIRLTANNIIHPDAIVLEKIEPRDVRVRLDAVELPPAEPAPAKKKASP